MIISHFQKKNTVLILFIILSAFFVSLVWNNNVWMDEAFTASLVNTDLAGVLGRSMADTLPPLYNIILKLATAVFGYKIPVMKLTSVVPMIGTLAIGATTVRRRWKERTAVLFMLFVTFMPLMLYYGVEIRMYSLGFFFATGSAVYAYEAVADGSKKSWAIFTLLSVLAGYSHHFAFVAAGFSYLFILLYFLIFHRERIREWLLCLAATFVLYLPCLIVTLKQLSRVSGYFSMPDIDAAMFIQYAVYPYTVGITPASALCCLAMAAAVALFVLSLRDRDNRGEKMMYPLFVFATYYGVLLFGTIVSKIMTANIFVDRYLFFSTGILWLFAAIVLGRSDNRVYICTIAVTVIIGACTYGLEIRTEYANTADEEIAFLRENVSEGDIYYSIGGHEEMQNCIPFYTYIEKDTPDLTFEPSLETAIDMSDETGSTLWISVLDGYKPSEEDLALLSDRGLSMVKAADFEFDRYKCEMYKVTRDGL